LRAKGNRKQSETVQGNCVKCNRRTRHAIRSREGATEYFECLKCGNEVDVKAFVYDNLDALN
jgi:transcription elongation factor Elf1